MLSFLNFEQLLDHALFNHLVEALVVKFFPEDFSLSHRLLDLQRQLVNVLSGVVILGAKRLQNLAVSQIKVTLLYFFEVHCRRSINDIA